MLDAFNSDFVSSGRKFIPDGERLRGLATENIKKSTNP
jgi:hypothetical protein